MGWTGIDHPCRRQLCCVDLCCLTRLRRAHQHGRMVDTERDDLMLRDKCKLCRGGGSMSCRKCYGKGMLQLRSRALRSSAGGCAIFRRGCVCLWTRCCVLRCCCPSAMRTNRHTFPSPHPSPLSCGRSLERGSHCVFLCIACIARVACVRAHALCAQTR